MLPLGSEGGFHFRMIWDEELETEMGSKGTDGTAREEKRQNHVSPTAPLDGARDGQRTLGHPTGHTGGPQNPGARAAPHAAKHVIPFVGIPSNQSRAARSFTDMGLSGLSSRRQFTSIFLFHSQSNINLTTLTSSVGLNVDDFTLCTVGSSFIREGDQSFDKHGVLCPWLQAPQKPPGLGLGLGLVGARRRIDIHNRPAV